MKIDTAHLQLRSFEPAHLLALLDGAPDFEELSGLKAAEGLRGFFTSDAVSPAWLARLRAASEANPWEHGFAVIDRASSLTVGTASFKGEPDGEGMVEVAYGIVPGYQGRGYATEACAALVDFAMASDRVRLVRAHTLPEPNPSTRVLEKCGFEFIGEVIEPEDGLVWRWERGRG